MPPSTAPGSPRDWLSRAQGKLAVAKAPLPPGGYYEDLCFFAQQAAELAIKAVYQQNGWKFAFTHELDPLLVGLTGHGLVVPEGVEEADVLSIYAAFTRYPNPAPAVTRTQYDEAVAIAEVVVAWAATLVP